MIPQEAWPLPEPVDMTAPEWRYRRMAQLASGVRRALDLWLQGRLLAASMPALADGLEEFAAYLRKP